MTVNIYTSDGKVKVNEEDNADYLNMKIDGSTIVVNADGKISVGNPVNTSISGNENDILVLNNNGYPISSNISISDVSLVNHNHDDLYYTKIYIDNILNTKLNVPSIFTANMIPIFDSTGQLINSGKYISDFADLHHTHVISDITDFDSSNLVTISDDQTITGTKTFDTINSTNINSQSSSIENLIINSSIKFDTVNSIDKIYINSSNNPFFGYDKSNNVWIFGDDTSQSIIAKSTDIDDKVSDLETKLTNGTISVYNSLYLNGKQDSDFADVNHKHDDLYYEKSEVDALLSTKLSKFATYTENNIVLINNDGTLKDSGQTIDDIVAGSVDLSDYYTKDETDNLLIKKLNVPSSFITNRIPIFDSTGQLIDSGKYVTDFASVDHNHDDLYYQKSEVDTKINDIDSKISSFDTDGNGIVDNSEKVDFLTGYVNCMYGVFSSYISSAVLRNNTDISLIFGYQTSDMSTKIKFLFNDTSTEIGNISYDGLTIKNIKVLNDSNISNISLNDATNVEKIKIQFDDGTDSFYIKYFDGTAYQNKIVVDNTKVTIDNIESQSITTNSLSAQNLSTSSMTMDSLTISNELIIPLNSSLSSDGQISYNTSVDELSIFNNSEINTLIGTKNIGDELIYENNKLSINNVSISKISFDSNSYNLNLPTTAPTTPITSSTYYDSTNDELNIYNENDSSYNTLIGTKNIGDELKYENNKLIIDNISILKILFDSNNYNLVVPTTEPTTPSGGSLYFDETTNELKIYNSTDGTWKSITLS